MVITKMVLCWNYATSVLPGADFPYSHFESLYTYIIIITKKR